VKLNVLFNNVLTNTNINEPSTTITVSTSEPAMLRAGTASDVRVFGACQPDTVSQVRSSCPSPAVPHVCLLSPVF
jgi:hypothetical protein